MQIGDPRLREHGVELAGVEHDPLLYAYLLDPTYSSYALPEVAFRKFNLKMGAIARRSCRHHPAPRRASCATKSEQAGLRKVYDEIDLPLVPVLARMEEAGVKLDCEVLAEMSQRLERDISAKAREIYDKVGRRVQHQLAQAARRRALQQAQSA